MTEFKHPEKREKKIDWKLDTIVSSQTVSLIEQICENLQRYLIKNLIYLYYKHLLRNSRKRTIIHMKCIIIHCKYF